MYFKNENKDIEFIASRPTLKEILKGFLQAGPK